MYKKLIYLISFVLVLGPTTGVTNADIATELLVYWPLNEGAGSTVLDATGNGHNGTFNGDPQWVDGKNGKALHFDGVDDFVTHSLPGDRTYASFTIAVWAKADDVPQADLAGLFSSHEPGGSTGAGFQIDVDAGSMVYQIRPPGSAGAFGDATTDWVHLAVACEGTSAQLYYQGAPTNQATLASDLFNEFTVGVNRNRSRWFAGTIDEFRVYSRVLTTDDIAELYEWTPSPPMKAQNPDPDHGATDVPRDIALSWTPGEYAGTHDVYFGTSFEDVNTATIASPEYKGSQSETAYVPDHRLDFGQTYFWRVDEVNAPPDFTIFKGDVWSFTVEPYAYPMESITATASSANKADEGPENTINSSGLDGYDLHSYENAAMWLSSGIDPNATWIKYEFDRVYKLHQMLVWNYNSSVEPLIGFGIRDATIEYSVDGTGWNLLGTTHEFARGPGAAGYAPNTTVDLSGVAAKYVKITANSNWGGMVNQYGLSEVRFLYIPVWATEPSPDSGATDVDVDAILSFRAGREAAKHDVYISTDEQAVIDGNVPVASVTEPSYAPSLDLAGTYYWRIDEVNDAEIPTAGQGDIWNLSTQEYLVVDDFESYNDIPAGEEGSNLVYGTWVDGFENPANGSTIGYNEPFQPTIETSLVYDGQQSVPLFYDNTVATYSEVTANVADLDVGRDWTMHGIKALTLRFFGDPNNAVQQMYVKINGSRVTYDGSAEDTRLTGWQMWYIDLASLGVSLSNVTELTIGFERIGAVGGKGMVLLDGIRLYSYDRQLTTPADPGTTGLQAHYEFEGNTNDSSGNARNGTAVGNPDFVAGKIGQAINLRGLNDYVEITGYKGILGPNAFSISAWIKTASLEQQEIVYYGTNADGQRCEFRVHDTGRIRMGNGAGQVEGRTVVTDGAWHHVAVTISENATNSSSDVRIYVDGQDDTQETTDPDAFNLVADWDVTMGCRPSQQDRFFNGQIDDVRIYDRALSAEEPAWLAGRTMSFDRPF